MQAAGNGVIQGLIIGDPATKPFQSDRDLLQAIPYCVSDYFCLPVGHYFFSKSFTFPRSPFTPL